MKDKIFFTITLFTRNNKMDTLTVREWFKLLPYDKWLQVACYHNEKSVPQLPVDILADILLKCEDAATTRCFICALRLKPVLHSSVSLRSRLLKKWIRQLFLPDNRNDHQLCWGWLLLNGYAWRKIEHVFVICQLRRQLIRVTMGEFRAAIEPEEKGGSVCISFKADDSTTVNAVFQSPHNKAVYKLTYVYKDPFANIVDCNVIDIEAERMRYELMPKVDSNMELCNTEVFTGFHFLPTGQRLRLSAFVDFLFRLKQTYYSMTQSLASFKTAVQTVVMDTDIAQCLSLKEFDDIVKKCS